MFKLHAILLGMVLSIGVAFGQKEITGTVTSAEDGLGIPGVSVVLKDSQKGAMTTIEGTYSLTVPEDKFMEGTLVFSFIGYKKVEKAILGREEINVTLEPDVELLDEVVVTAIGIKKDKRKLGYAVTEVKNEELKQSGEMNLMNALNAKVAGVSVTSSSGTPGASVAVRIRGNKSVGGNNDPLYVIDGVPVDNSYRGSNFTDQSNRMIDINPEDIESISVLKGGAASALYGFRAANGAVVITTKKGKSGKTTVEFQSTTTFDQVNKLPEKQFSFGQGTGGEFVPNSQFTWGDRITGESFDHGERFFQTGVTADNYVGIRGGNEKADFSVSLGHLRQSGIIPQSFYNRTTLKVTGNTSFNDKFSMGATVTLSDSKANRPQRGSNLSGVMLGLMRAPTDYDLTNGVDDPVENELAYQNPDGTQRTYFENYDNPYWSINKNRNEELNLRAIGLVNLQYQILDNLSLTNKISLDAYTNERKSYWDAQSNEFSADNGRIFNLAASQKNFNNDFLLNYDNTFGDLELTALLGHNYFDFQTRTYEIEGLGFIVDGFYDFSNTNIINGFADDFLTRQRGYGVYADVNLGWKDQLYLGITGRNDWLSNLPAGNNGFFYPSVSAGWIFSQTLGLEGNTFSYGKLRVSWANTGNGAPAPYLTSDYFVQGEGVHGLTTFQPNSSLGSPQLRPENTNSVEAGFDIRLLENRIGIDITGYYTQTSDPIVTVQIPSSSGYFTTTLNGDGSIVNQGIEALINATVLEKQVVWNTGFNFTLNRNEVESIIAGTDVIPLPSFGLASTQSVVIPGQPFGVLMGTAWQRDAAGNIMVGDDGYPIKDPERQIIGDPNPGWTGGWRNDFSWRSFRMSFLFDIRVGGDMFNGTRNVMRFHGTHVDTEDRDQEIVWDGVNVNTGEANTVPIELDENFYSRYGLTYISEEGIEEVNWFRLRDLSLTYTLNREVTDRIGITGASIAIITRNLLLFTSYSGIDPETSLSGAGNSFGRDYFNSPNTKSVGIRLNITL